MSTPPHATPNAGSTPTAPSRAPAGPRTLSLPFGWQVDCLLDVPGVPGSEPPALLVCLHGQGQDGARQRRWMTPAVPPTFAAAYPDGFHGLEVRRPERPVRIGRAWYHYSTEDRAAFLASLDRAVAGLWRVVDAALDTLGADPQRVFLAGFSQGAYLAHVAALRAPERVAGWIAQAGGLRPDYVPGGLPALQRTPVLLQHGAQDPVTSPQAARDAAALLEAAGARVTLELPDGDHRISPAMTAGARAWLTRHEEVRATG